ncbi:MAG: hypothetical protein KDC54_00970 [Lewinella sp.]|nr:hypothetical protein [Lewinella sp.]
MKKAILPGLLLVGLLWGATARAQTWSLHLNTNTVFPLGNALKGQFPMLWYSGADDRGLLLGGFGGGLAYHRPTAGKLEWTLGLHVQRSRLYDQPSIIYDDNGQPLLGNIGVQTNLNLSALALPTLALTPGGQLRVGAGLGLRSLLYARTDYGESLVDGQVVSLHLRNRSGRPFVALLPVELSLHRGRWSLANRWELGLTPASRLAAYRTERQLWSVLEIGMRL